MTDSDLVELWDRLRNIILPVAGLAGWLLWMWTRRHKRLQETRTRQAMNALVRSIGGGWRLLDEASGDSEGRGSHAGREFVLSDIRVMRSGQRHNVRLLRVSTPLRFVPLSLFVEFKALPRWAPSFLRQYPFSASGPIVDGAWCDDAVRQGVGLVFSQGDDRGALCVASGRLVWTLELWRSGANVPETESFKGRLNALASLADHLEMRLAEPREPLRE